MKYTFTGWKTFVVKQTFTIEADSKEEAIEELLENETSFENDPHWLDYNTNSISSPEQPDFYDEDEELIG